MGGNFGHAMPMHGEPGALLCLGERRSVSVRPSLCVWSLYPMIRQMSFTFRERAVGP